MTMSFVFPSLQSLNRPTSSLSSFRSPDSRGLHEVTTRNYVSLKITTNFDPKIPKDLTGSACFSVKFRSGFSPSSFGVDADGLSAITEQKRKSVLRLCGALSGFHNAGKLFHEMCKRKNTEPSMETLFDLLNPSGSNSQMNERIDSGIGVFCIRLSMDERALISDLDFPPYLDLPKGCPLGVFNNGVLSSSSLLSSYTIMNVSSKNKRGSSHVAYATRRDNKGSKVLKKTPVREVLRGVFYIQASMNNTRVTITDLEGNVLVWSTGGSCKFKGAQRKTPYAAECAAKDAIEKVKKHGLKKVEVRLKGAGIGRDSALTAICSSELEVVVVRECTPLPHNGCRPRKRKR